jgi:hypothetical protein
MTEPNALLKRMFLPATITAVICTTAIAYLLTEMK